MKSLLCLMLLSVCVGQALAQQTQPDTTRPAFITPDKIRPSDAVLHRDSIRYAVLREKMKKRGGLMAGLYDLLFRYPYNTNAGTQQIASLADNVYRPYQGRIIRSIRIRQLNVFGQSVYDTTRNTGRRLERWGNQLHKNTQEAVVRRSFLLFREGDVLSPYLLKDSERLLRQSGLLVDARILVIPAPGYTQLVDVYVLTQDVWSLMPNAGFSGFDNFYVSLEQRNFRGLAHQYKAHYAYRGNDPYQRHEWYFRYRIPYWGRSLISTEAEIRNLRDSRRLGAVVQRQFLTPDIRWAGSFELSLYRENRYFFISPGSTETVRSTLTYGLQDAWLGHSFKFNFRDTTLRERARLIMAYRTTGLSYFGRKNLPRNAESLFPDTRTNLGSIGFSNRQYTRDVLIYGFGRTEDVPLGYLASLTYGTENGDLGRRRFGSLRGAYGHYLSARWGGYFYGLMQVGGYFGEKKLQQGMWHLETNYFSPLLTLGKRSAIRNFITLRYTQGINRFDYEYLTASRTEGLTSVRTDALRGTRRLTFNYQGVLFSSFQLLGFRIATYGFIDLVGLAPKEVPLLKTIYQGYGIGFRFRNENLTFNTFQVRLGYYPNVPHLLSPLVVEASGETLLRLPDFQIEAPDRTDYFRSSR